MTECRACRSRSLKRYIDFGRQPVSTILLDSPRKDLSLFDTAHDYCNDCGHVQRRVAVDPAMLYVEYTRLRSSSTPAYVYQLADHIAGELVGAKTDLIVEIGSNDGMFLKELLALGMEHVLGVEAAHNCMAAATADGIPTLHEFFSLQTAETIRTSYGTPRVIIIRHLLEHMEDPDAFLGAVRSLMSDDTRLVIEVPDLRWAVDRGDFTSFTEQHISYFSPRSLQTLLNRHGLRISSRSIVPNNWSDAILCTCSLGTGDVLPDGKLPFASQSRFLQLMADLRHFFDGLAERKESIACFGGFCRTANFVNYLHLDVSRISFVADDNSAIHGKCLPGSNLTIEGAARLATDAIDNCFICTVNYEAKIIANHGDFLSGGGRFIKMFPPETITA